jgi:anti-anti-sigma factor
MNVNIENNAGILIANPEGRLDFGASANFQSLLEKSIAGDGSKPRALLVDCSSLEYVSSAGLRAFLVGARSAKSAGVGFGVCNLKPGVREVFDVSGFGRIIAVHADRAAALAALSA